MMARSWPLLPHGTLGFVLFLILCSSSEGRCGWASCGPGAEELSSRCPCLLPGLVELRPLAVLPFSLLIASVLSAFNFCLFHQHRRRQEIQLQPVRNSRHRELGTSVNVTWLECSRCRIRTGPTVPCPKDGEIYR